MLVIDYLTSIFKKFNLTAFVQNNGSIKVETLDNYYNNGKVIDITNLIDINKSEVKRFEPFTEINFEFEKSETLLLVKRNKLLDDVFGNLNFKIASESTTKIIGGGVYNINSKFNKILPERLRLDDDTLSPIMYGLYVNEELEPLSNQPILFYTNRQSFQETNAIEFQNGENLSSNIAPSNVKQDLTQTLNFGAEIDEYTLKVNFNSLFNNFYRNFILRAFSLRSRILKVKAYLNVDFILNYELKDTFIINGRKFNINNLDVNLSTGEASLELKNIFPIPPIIVQPPPTFQTLTISSLSQSGNDSAGSYTFDVISNVNWQVTENSEFISVSPASGSKDGTITVTYLENDTTDTRSGIVTVTGGGFTRLHTLTQTGKEVELTISSPSNTVPKEEGSYTIQISSNTNWTVSDNQTWLSQSPTNGFGDATLTFNFDKNSGTNEREAITEIKAGNVTRTHTTTQQAQSSSQLFTHGLRQASSLQQVCEGYSITQIYYTDSTNYVDSTVIFFDNNGNNKVGSGFFAKGIDVLETNNGEVINVLTCS